MTGEVERWHQAGIEASSKREGELMPQTNRLNSLFTEYSAELSRQRLEKIKYDVIPEFPFSYKAHDRKTQLGTAYFIRKSSRSALLQDVECLFQLYGNDSKRLSLKVDTGIVIETDQPDTEFKDINLLDSILDAAESNLEQRKQLRINRKKAAARSLIKILAPLAAVGTLIGTGFIYESNHKSKTEAKLAAAKRFDAASPVLPGQFIEPPKSFIHYMDENKFSHLPDYQDGIALNNPHIVEIEKTMSCVRTNSPYPIQDRAIVYDVFGYTDDIIPLRNKGGSVSVCRLDDDYQDFYVGIQTVNGADKNASISTYNKEAHVNYISEAVYRNIPTDDGNSNFRHPRRITINSSESCINTNAPLNEGDAVNISDVVGTNDDIVALRNRGGTLSICRLDDRQSAWEVAVQIR